LSLSFACILSMQPSSHPSMILTRLSSVMAPHIVAGSIQRHDKIPQKGGLRKGTDEQGTDEIVSGFANRVLALAQAQPRADRPAAEDGIRSGEFSTPRPAAGGSNQTSEDSSWSKAHGVSIAAWKDIKDSRDAGCHVPRLPTERTRSNSRGLSPNCFGLAANTNSILCDGPQEPETVTGGPVLPRQEPLPGGTVRDCEFRRCWSARSPAAPGEVRVPFDKTYMDVGIWK
jgi:hypothetical protein